MTIAGKGSKPLRTKRAEAAQRRRKNLNIDQGKLERVMTLYGTATETDAVDLALAQAIDLAAFRTEALAGLGELLGAGGFDFHGDDETALDFSGFAPAASTGRRKA